MFRLTISRLRKTLRTLRKDNYLLNFYVVGSVVSNLMSVDKFSLFKIIISLHLVDAWWPVAAAQIPPPATPSPATPVVPANTLRKMHLNSIILFSLLSSKQMFSSILSVLLF